ncbi:hypothetical protein BC830DRAFT_1077715 [Chytriomyces sp. MP71]|nr:hypothetical protein BC830DRAFT_1077715 [Chytriomyces sp. MP71]
MFPSKKVLLYQRTLWQEIIQWQRATIHATETRTWLTTPSAHPQSTETGLQRAASGSKPRRHPPSEAEGSVIPQAGNRLRETWPEECIESIEELAVNVSKEWANASKIKKIIAKLIHKHKASISGDWFLIKQKFVKNASTKWILQDGGPKGKERQFDDDYSLTALFGLKTLLSKLGLYERQQSSGKLFKLTPNKKIFDDSLTTIIVPPYEKLDTLENVNVVYTEKNNLTDLVVHLAEMENVVYKTRTNNGKIVRLEYKNNVTIELNKDYKTAKPLCEVLVIPFEIKISLHCLLKHLTFTSQKIKLKALFINYKKRVIVDTICKPQHGADLNSLISKNAIQHV